MYCIDEIIIIESISIKIKLLVDDLEHCGYRSLQKSKL